MASLPVEEKYGYEDSRFEKDIDANFHCSICYNVLKEPMMCRNNEHIFCRACITEHLNVNSQTCPECNENLSIRTLRRAPRVVINYLSELKIKCDYSSRGCQEMIQLETLDGHVESCGFAPVKCSNEECEMVINKREAIHHESTVCMYRKAKCHTCGKIEKDVEEMKEKMNDIARMKDDVNQVKALMVQMFQKLSFLDENTIQIATIINQDIFITGGLDHLGNALKSAERFSWKNDVWERVSSMNVGRKEGTSFVYENQLFVAGGCDNDGIEVLHLNEDVLQWAQAMVTLPHHCMRLASVVYRNRAICFGDCSKNVIDTDACIELSLALPYTCKQLCEMPKPARKYYSVVAFEHKVLILGGRNALDFNLDSVLEFDINTNEFKVMPPLPYAVSYMAAVRWGDQAVLIGGSDKDGQSRKVFMYDSKTGKSTELPSMLEERLGCAAVITGNMIVAMGGRGKKTGRVRSVEAFTLGGYSWSYLPAMNDVRSAPSATVIPTNVH